MKVYCSECKWYFNDWSGSCKAPDNRKDTYHMKEGSLYLDPSDKNKHNNCVSFERKAALLERLKNLFN